MEEMGWVRWRLIVPWRWVFEKARKFGIGSVLVRNTNHIGILAFYALMAAEQGMVGIVMCNGRLPCRPGEEPKPFFGTNPISIRCSRWGSGPGGSDMSSSVVARGKIRRAERMKEPIPLGWAFDETGTPTTDPAAAMKGTLMPLEGQRLWFGPHGRCPGRLAFGVSVWPQRQDIPSTPGSHRYWCFYDGDRCRDGSCPFINSNH